MNQAEILDALEEHGAVSHGHFELSSGRHSDLYVQSAQVLQWPGMAERLGHELGTALSGEQPEAVLSLALGGLIIGHETARQLGVRMIFVERVEGRLQLRRDFRLHPHERVAVVEDVVTTGGSPKEAIALAEHAGARVVAVGAIVDRSADVSFGVPFHWLLRLRAESWPADACPLCAAGQPVDSPGSRHLTR